MKSAPFFPARALATLCLAGACLAADTASPARRTGALALDLSQTRWRGTNFTVLQRTAEGVLATAAVLRPTRETRESVAALTNVFTPGAAASPPPPRPGPVRPPPFEQAVVFGQHRALTGQLDRARTEFPGELVLRTPQGAPRAGAVFLEPRTSPLPWDARAKAYTTRLVAGVDLREAGDPAPLEPPVVIQFFAEQADVSPASVSITRTGTGGYQEVELTCRKSAARPRVTARSDFGELAQHIPLEPLGLLALLESILPLRFLLVALLGGGLGGGLRTAGRGAGRGTGRAPGLILQGAAVGLVVVCAVSAGLGWAGLPVEVVGAEVGVFAVSALAGLAGVAVLHRLRLRVFGADVEKTP
jgi:hypothetical protein